MPRPGAPTPGRTPSKATSPCAPAAGTPAGPLPRCLPSGETGAWGGVLVGGCGWQAAEADVEARVGGETTGAEEGCGETLGVARALGRGGSVVRGVPGRGTSPPGPRQPGSDLGSQPRAYPVWEEKSLCNCPPAPPPAEEAPTPHPAAGPAPPTPPLGRDPRCTHCKKCTFRGRGWGAAWRGSELPGKGTPCPEPPSARALGRKDPPAPRLAHGGGRWERVV